MSVPPSVTKIKKDGVEFISSVDRCSYTMKELCRAALRDVGKFICISTNKEAQKLPGLKKSKRVRGTKGAFQFWVKHKYEDYPTLQVGIKHNTWYGVEQEVGSSKMKKYGFLTNSTQNNVATIVEIESKYLSALEDKDEALELISDEDYQGGGDDAET